MCNLHLTMQTMTSLSMSTLQDLNHHGGNQCMGVSSMKIGNCCWTEHVDFISIFCLYWRLKVAKSQLTSIIELFLSIFSRAYEIAATQNARSLGENARRSSHGKKRTTNPSENNNAAPRIQSSQLDQNIKNLRHDSQPDNSSLRRTDDAPSPSKNLFGNEAGELKASTTGTSSRIIDDPEIQEEWSNIRDLARDLFQVYFTTDDSYADVEKMNHIKCKFHSLFLGTIPWLTQYIQKLDLPRPVVETLLFIEASFRGIGQVTGIFYY